MLELLDRLDPTIEELTAAVEREASTRPEAMRLTHPGVGAITALAYVLERLPQFDFVAIGIVYPGEATLGSMRRPSFAKRSGN